MRTLILFISISICSAHDKPVIGILTPESTRFVQNVYGSQFESFLPASYVKWVESGGARVVPIKIGRDRVYYQKIMEKINGVLLPGGSADKTLANGFSEKKSYEKES